MFIKRILFNEQYQSKIIYQKQTADLCRHESKMDSAFLPAFIVPESKEETFSINGVSIAIDASIDDEILKRIIRICSEL